MPLTRRSFLVATPLITSTLLARRAGADGSWETNLAKLTSAIKCRGALYGHDAVQWAGRSQVTAAVDEVKYLLAGFANPASLFATGPKVETLKYMATRADGTVIVLKLGPKGCVFVKTAKTMIGCLFEEANVTPANALIATQKFASYIKSLGF